MMPLSLFQDNVCGENLLSVAHNKKVVNHVKLHVASINLSMLKQKLKHIMSLVLVYKKK